MPTVFGLDVVTETPLPFLETAIAEPTGRRLEVTLREDGSEPAWPAGATLISDERQPDGAVSFQIEADPEAGFRVAGPEYGASVISPDGACLVGAPGSAGLDAWQRMLVAQALPFAAVLRGLEVLHASAVAVAGDAVGLAGPSGSGKTSLALELCRRGATLLADDVVALERVDEVLVAHPGPPVAGIDRAEADRLEALAGVRSPEVIAANSRERIARVAVGAEPAVLRTFFLLERREDGSRSPCFEAIGDAQALLASTFNLVLTDPRRLERLLDACALLAGSRVERVSYGAEVGVEELGAAIVRRIGVA